MKVHLAEKLYNYSARRRLFPEKTVFALYSTDRERLVSKNAGFCFGDQRLCIPLPS